MTQRESATAVVVTFVLGVGLRWYALDWRVALGTALLWIAKDLSADYRERNTMANIVGWRAATGSESGLRRCKVDRALRNINARLPESSRAAHSLLGLPRASSLWP